ncbi:MAG: hypothetical protein MJ227_01260 [Bacilli bacterium]|nr:hypothetical protein [Bacilli bacterium]
MKTNPSNASVDKLIDGGTISFDFDNVDDLSRFDTYTSYNALPRFYDHSMFSYIYAENKLILRDVKLTEYLIEADFAPIIYKGHIDTGFYLQADSPSSEVDHINAWQVCIKHDENTPNWDLRLYKFSGGSWKGQYIEASDLPFWNAEWIHLSCLVKNGIVTTYINNDYDNPLFSYNIGDKAGLVGIRAFKCPSKVRNITITSPSFKIDNTALTNLINTADTYNKDKYTPKSWEDFQTVLNFAREVKAYGKNQIIINETYKQLNDAINQLIEIKTFDELQQLIREAEKITDESKYTKNSYISLQKCLEIAKTYTDSSSVDDISYSYMMLSYRLKELIQYGVK